MMFLSQNLKKIRVIKKNITIAFLLLCSFNVLSQVIESENDSVAMKVISFNIFGTTPAIGITYEKLLRQKFSIEIGIGFISLGLSTKIYPFNFHENGLNFYSGFAIIYTPFMTNAIISYIPIGLSYSWKKGLIFGVDIGPGVYKQLNNGGTSIPYGNIKLGKRF